MNMPMRAAREPCLDRGRFMYGVVVDHERNIQVLRDISVDTFHEIQKFRDTMTFVAFAARRSPLAARRSPHPSRCRELQTAISFRHARYNRQDCLLAVQRLDLAFLVDEQHDRAFRPRHVKTDNIPNLADL